MDPVALGYWDGLESIKSVYSPVIGFCEHSHDESVDSLKVGKLLTE
jgi:hypothetical protein